MKIELDIDDLRPVIEAAVVATLEKLEADRAQLNGQLAYPEAEAASLLGVARHVLRDCRLRGEVKAKRIGKKNVYSRNELLKFLARTRS